MRLGISREPVRPVVAGSVEARAASETATLRRRGLGHAALVHAAVFGAYAVAAVALFHLAWAAPTRRLIGACCDSAAYVDTFRWTGAAVLHGHSPFFSHLDNAPTGVNVMWQPNVVPLVGLLATPFEALLGPMTTYNLVMTLAVALDGLACFVALRRWVGGAAGPFVGGAVFAFSPTIVAHSLGHAQITCAALVPLALLFAVDLLVEQRWRWWAAGACFGAVLALQLLVGEEVLADLCLTCVVVAVCAAALFHRGVRSKVAHAAKGLAVAAATAAVLAAWPLAVQFLGPERITGAFRDTRPFAVNPANYLVPVPGLQELGTHWTKVHAGAWFGSTGYAEADAYIGVTLAVGLLALVVLRWRQPLVRLVAVATAVLMVLSFGVDLHLGGATYDVWMPWRVLHALPILRDQMANRLSLEVDLGVAVLVAYGVALVARAERRRTRLLGSVVVVACLAPLLPTFHYRVYTPPQPAFFTTGAVDVIPSGSTVFVLPFPRGTAKDTPVMIWQADAGLRFAMPGGGIFVPEANGTNTQGGAQTTLTGAVRHLEFGLRYETQDAFILGIERAELASWDVRAVVVGPMPHEARAVAFMSRVLGAPPRHVNGVYLWTPVVRGRAAWQRTTSST